MKEGVRTTFIPKSLRMVAALHYYANGSFMRDVGQDCVSTMSKTMVCRSIKEIWYIVQNKLMGKYIRFPTTLEEQNKIKQRFFSSTGFPGCIGAIDCTHVKIKKPPMDVEFCYMNRKGYFSKNVQLICDFDINILGCFARFGGSSHDAYIWENCKAKEFLENEHSHGVDCTWLIGDSGYPLQPWLMTPFRNVESPGQEKYNKQHILARNCVERLNGVLKKVFACLSHERGILSSPEYSGVIINTCLTLHNFRMKHKQAIPRDLEQFDAHAEIVEEHIIDDFSILAQGRRIRENIVRNYFD